MTTTPFKLRRRASGAAGAPSALLSGEAAINMVDGILYIGVGDDGGGNATSVVAFAKTGFNAARFLPAGGTSGQALVKTGTTDYAVTWADLPSGGTTLTPGAGINIASGVVSVDYSAVAALASPTFTGAPAAPTAAAATNTTQLATTAFVQTAIAALINAAPGSLDTLKELADALGDDPNFATTMTSALAGKLAKASNLSDLTSAPTARTNLGLGTMATQSAGAVAITGGTIDGVTLDGGTF